MNEIIGLFSYPGSKRRFVKELNAIIAWGTAGCSTFIDAFGGSGAVTINAESFLFDRVIINELNLRLFLILWVLSQPTTRDELLWAIENTTFSRESFFKAKALWAQHEDELTYHTKSMLAIKDASTFEQQKEQWKNVIPRNKLVELAAAALVQYRLSFHGLANSQATRRFLTIIKGTANG